ncbi:GNAT family N-acetyltransferase [Niabella pedocola]|uniref:GNAT family N-acetyltransferase n=1 Tax=Niabella pedocola TaxID=1752077 RepID=A0ABS8PQH5_9BACT|nr:GNAT family N-acetyltransferase [Niabella pedocola]MCD2422567.1 GNAT family N-acetyltransferase [Niabella pedocola]
MIKAREQDRPVVVQILTEAFNDNKSVNYIIPQDAKRQKRIRLLMEYAFDVCMLSGEVFLTEEGNGCALVLFPDQKKASLQTMGLDLKLAVKATGIRNALKAMKREAALRKLQPDGRLYYLWFIGMRRDAQGRGNGSRLLSGLKQQASNTGRILCLETSALKNVPWYQKNGLEIYNEIDLGYPLYFMKWEST